MHCVVFLIIPYYTDPFNMYKTNILLLSLLMILSIIYPIHTLVCPGGPGGVLCVCVSSCCTAHNGTCIYTCPSESVCARSLCSAFPATTVAGECGAPQTCNQPVNNTVSACAGDEYFGRGYNQCKH